MVFFCAGGIGPPGIGPPCGIEEPGVSSQDVFSATASRATVENGLDITVLAVSAARGAAVSAGSQFSLGCQRGSKRPPAPGVRKYGGVSRGVASLISRLARNLEQNY